MYMHGHVGMIIGVRVKTRELDHPKFWYPDSGTYIDFHTKLAESVKLVFDRCEVSLTMDEGRRMDERTKGRLKDIHRH